MRKKAGRERTPRYDSADSQPWAQQFEDDRDDQGNLSRIATRQKKRGTSILTWVVWIALALLIIVPVAYQAIKSNSNSVSSGGNYRPEKITVAESTSKKKPAKKSSKAATTSSKKAPESSSSSEPSASSSSAPPESSSSQAVSSSQPPQQATYTIQAGDTLYRVAVNHGLTLQQLLTLNGLTANSYIAPGQVLRVK